MNIWIESFLCNLIVYLVFSFPIFILIKNIGVNTKRKTTYTIVASTIAEIFCFTILYMFPEEIFQCFPVREGVKNTSRFISRIIFICSSLNSFALIIPIFLFKKGHKKRIITLVLTKMITLVLSFSILLKVFSIETALFSVPCIDLLFDIILIILYIKN